MSLLRRLPALLAFLLLGALSLRLGLPFLWVLLGTLGVGSLLFFPQSWIQATLAALLALGALAWLVMTALRVQQRVALGDPWLRLASILVTVACFTAWAAWLVRPRD